MGAGVATIRVQTQPGGVWETLGSGRLRGLVPEGIEATANDWGPDALSFNVKAIDGAVWRPDLQPFTPISLEVDGQLVWSGRVKRKPGDATDHSVQAEGWQYHLDDDSLQRLYVLSDLGAWKDARENLGATLAATAYCAAGQTSVGAGGAMVGFPDTFVAQAGATVGLVIDLGPNPSNWARRCVLGIATSNNNNAAPALVGELYAGDAIGSLVLVSSSFALTTWGASSTMSGTASGSLGRRYWVLWLRNPGAGNHTMVGDAWVRITSMVLVSDTAYESGNVSILKADQVVKDARDLGAPLLDSSNDLIAAGTFSIPELAVGGYVTPRQLMETANAYEDYLLKVGGVALQSIVYKARPTVPLFEVTEGSGVGVSDASLSGDEVHNSVVVQGTGPDAVDISVRRASADVAGVAFDRRASRQLSNPSMDVDASGWTLDFGPAGPARDAATFDTSPGSLVQAATASSQFYATITGLRPGFRYRLQYRSAKNAALATNCYVQVRDSTGTAGYLLAQTTMLAASMTNAPVWTTWTVDFTARSSTVSVVLGVAGGSVGGNVWWDELRLLTTSRTAPDRAEFNRSKVIAVRSRATASVLNRFGDLWLASRLSLPFVAKLTVTGPSVRRALGGGTVPPAELLLHTGERIRVAGRVNPDTGGVGREGVIRAVRYVHDRRLVEVDVDDRRDAFERILARFSSLADQIR